MAHYARRAFKTLCTAKEAKKAAGYFPGVFKRRRGIVVPEGEAACVNFPNRYYRALTPTLRRRKSTGALPARASERNIAEVAEDEHHSRRNNSSFFAIPVLYTSRLRSGDFTLSFVYPRRLY